MKASFVHCFKPEDEILEEKRYYTKPLPGAVRKPEKFYQAVWYARHKDKKNRLRRQARRDARELQDC